MRANHNLSIGIFLLTISTALLPTNIFAAETCTQMDAYAAETVTDYLDSWHNVYLFYKQFRQCYDGAIAEGAADKIEQLWANHWDTLPEMIALTQKDAEFKKFIWDWIGEEIFPQDRFTVVLHKARTSCPKGAEEFCQSIINAAKQR